MSEAPGWSVDGFHHVLLAMPPGGEPAAEAFYRDRLGFEMVRKPDHLTARGGCWFRFGGTELHLGVDDGFAASRKSHPAFLVRGLSELREALEAAGIAIQDDEPLDGHDRWYVRDPFGNRLELIEEVVG